VKFSHLICLLCIAICFINFNSKAQVVQPAGVQEQDAEFWTGVELKKEIKDNVSFSLGQQVRFNNNIQRFKSTFTEAGFTFGLDRISDRLKINTSLRYTYSFSRKRTWRPLLNLSLQLIKNEYAKVNYRIRLQKDLLRFDAEQFDQKFYWRNKLTVNFKTGKVRPYIGAEIFYNGSNNAKEFDQLRILVGFEYKVKKRQEIKFGYVYREDFNVNNPGQNNIFQLYWNFEVKDLKKKKKKKS